MTAFRLALGFLTVIPVRPVAEIGRRQARAAMLLAPFAVLPVALLAALAGWAGLEVGLPSALAGLLVVAVVTLGTRALHLDGLADAVDGLGSGPDREKSLRILRSGDVGPMGVVALVLVIGVQALGYGAALDRPWGWVVVAVALAGSRVALSQGCARGVPAARPDGLGALFAGSVPVVAVVAGWLGLAGALAGALDATGRTWWPGVLGAALAAGAAGWLLRRSVQRFGGMTGDVLGALVEVTSGVLALVLAAGVAG
jgi:adenosylcobinamide-GDP ribazoletransferase